jgi:hypothetical protein
LSCMGSFPFVVFVFLYQTRHPEAPERSGGLEGQRARLLQLGRSSFEGHSAARCAAELAP